MRNRTTSPVIRTFATGGRGLGGILAMIVTVASAAEPLPGTKPLTLEGDIPAQLLDGAHKFVDREIERSATTRHEHWKSKVGDTNFIQQARDRLKDCLGIQSVRASNQSPNPIAAQISELTLGNTSRAKFERFESVAVTWPVAQGVQAYGTYLRPTSHDTNILVVVLEDRDLAIDTSPVSMNRSRKGFGPERNMAVRLANAGFHVMLPLLIDREVDHYEIGTKLVNQTRREFLYRQAFEVGRQVVGYDLQKTLSLVDWAEQRMFKKVAVAGYGEGGVQALYAGALDDRIDAVIVGASFGRLARPWLEPADRNIWGGISEFGDAELAAMIAPRRLMIHTVTNAGYLPKNQADIVKGAAPGVLTVPTKEIAEREWSRFVDLTKTNAIGPAWANHLVDSGFPSNLGKSSVAWLGKVFGESLTMDTYDCERDRDRLDFEGFPEEECEAWSDFTQKLIAESEYVRQSDMHDDAIKSRKSRNVEDWAKVVPMMQQYFYDEVIGRFEHDLKPFNAHTRQVYDTDKYRGYEVTLDVFDDVIAYGVLLVPKDIKPGEQRPVVVCQHGLEGRPQDTIEKDIPGERYYHQFAAKLAERGFVTFAPQNLYIFKDRFRELQRKLNPLKKTLFSLIVPQHEQICRWLKSQPFVDGSRIGFYGLSYGGKTAMRVPPLVDHYSCVICSGDFNDWIRKCTSIRDPFSYVGTGEYEIWEWNLANTFNYAEMAGLICPRPFMVERGHRDGVGIDEWVDYEYAKVRLLYVDLKIPERTEIEHFDGPHEINGVGSYKFLHKHLNWPEPQGASQ